MRIELKTNNNFVSSLTYLYHFFFNKDSETDGPELSDWEKYASEEYENLLAEVGVSEDL